MQNAVKYKEVFIMKRVLNDLGVLNTPTQYKDLSNHIKNNTPRQDYFSPDEIKAYAEAEKPCTENFMASLLQSVSKDYSSYNSFMIGLETDTQSLSW